MHGVCCLISLIQLDTTSGLAEVQAIFNSQHTERTSLGSPFKQFCPWKLIETPENRFGSNLSPYVFHWTLSLYISLLHPGKTSDGTKTIACPSENNLQSQACLFGFHVSRRYIDCFKLFLSFSGYLSLAGPELRYRKLARASREWSGWVQL
jgi:hypothetical protein